LPAYVQGSPTAQITDITVAVKNNELIFRIVIPNGISRRDTRMVGAYYDNFTHSLLSPFGIFLSIIEFLPFGRYSLLKKSTIIRLLL
jgi:hypothetical protein